jgi:hypothetical protein
MSWGIPHKITIEVNFHFDRLVIEHIEGKVGDMTLEEENEAAAKIDHLAEVINAPPKTP